MKKRLYVLITVLSTIVVVPISGFSADWATSDGSCYTQGDKIGSLGLSVYNFGLYGTFDYGVHDAISIGGGVGFNGHSDLAWRYTYLPIMVRGALHPFNLSFLADKIAVRNMVDAYIGITLGWRIGWLKWKADGVPVREPTDLNDGFAIPREFIGIRYYFSEKLSLFIEHCPELTNIAGGIGYRF